MSREKLLILGTSAVALIAMLIALQQRSGKLQHATVLAFALRQQHMLTEQIANLEKRLALAEERFATAEKSLSNELRSHAQPPSAVPPVKLTQAYVESRYKRAQELVKNGDHKEALAEFLWCYDTGMPPVAGYGGVRYSFLLSKIAKLGEIYPPALAALRERRNQNQKELAAGSTDFDVIQGFKSINTALGEKEGVLPYYDRLPSDAPGKQTMALFVYEELATAQRYNEAAQIKSFRDMMGWVEDLAELSKAPNVKSSNETRKHASQVGAGFVEVLAGAGKLADARDLAELIRAYDSSPETAALLERSATRAGHPNLFAPAPTTSVSP